jgi:MtN3 and saliva related transmembrane protein
VTSTDLLGYCAATLTTLSFLPQALLTLRTRNVAGISLGMYSAFTAGVALWLAYGLVLGEWPIVIANALTLGLALLILVLKVVVGRQQRVAAGQRAAPDPRRGQNGLPTARATASELSRAWPP